MLDLMRLFRGGRRAHPGRDPKRVNRCRQIAQNALDDATLRSRVKGYWTSTGAHDYDKSWQSRLTLIMKVIEEGESHLSRAIPEIVRRLEKARNIGMEPTGHAAFDKVVQLPPRPAGALHRATVVETVIDLCSPNTETIIELGSGWGEHLCNLWLEGAPRDASYYACEISESGRKCALVLAALEEAFNLQAAYFNYVQPDFPTIPTGQKEVVVYSVHSVEQVPEVPIDLIKKLCAMGDVVRGAHFEPIGWQMIEDGKKNEMTLAHQKRCETNKYNRNFWPMLLQAQAEGLITIETAIPNFFGRDYNPASYIVWRKNSK